MNASSAAIPKTELGSPSAPCRTIVTHLPERLGFLLQMHRYKIVYGGRGAAKSHSFARALLNLGAAQKLRILCAREVQESITKSVYTLLKDVIQELGLGNFYQVLDDEIRGANGTQIGFTGLGQHTVDSIKSFEGVDIVWVEEAQTVKKRSWDILIPTIRAPGSEIWISFNPDMDTDETWVRFVVNTPPGMPDAPTMLVKMNYYDNPWFPAELEAERKHAKKTAPDDYANIWEGECKTVVAGAVFAREVIQAIEEGRIRPVPYDPRFPVHRFWDLGWNDAMTTLMLQKTSPNSLNIINYLEDSGRRYDEFIGDMKALGYNFGEDWLPHDGEHHNPITGTDAKTTLIKLGCRVRIMDKTDPESRVRASRLVFPRIYIDNTARKRDTGYLGGARLVDCLKRLTRIIPRTTGEPGSVLHNQFSHGFDAFGGMAENVELIRNDLEPKPIPLLPAYESYDAGMGPMG